jgi:hypothetical protein
MAFESQGSLVEVDHKVAAEFGAFIDMHQEIVTRKFMFNFTMIWWSILNQVGTLP